MKTGAVAPLVVAPRKRRTDFGAICDNMQIVRRIPIVNYRKLGKTNFEVSEIGYGAWGIGGKQWLGGSDDESVVALRRAIELGVNFIDTALAYGDGHSEKLVGRVVRETGQRVFVATKVPPQDRVWPAKRGVGIERVFPYDYIVRSAEESLRNLGLDAIDLLQLHVWNPEWVDREEWRSAFEHLKSSGKVRAVGVSLSEHDPDSGLSVVRTGLIDAVQVIYNIFDQLPEQQLLPLCMQASVGVLARVPLDEGGLSGRLDEHTKFPPGDFRDYYFRGDRKKQVVEHVDALRGDLGKADLPEVALRFCLSHPAVTTVIPGMRTKHHVESNVAASGRGALPAETLAILKRHAWDRNFYS
jgi:aryl-alcohol dehydrogenase-like predicted oxidoreductase